MIVPVSVFQTYANKMGSSENEMILKNHYLQAAEEVVKKYLGYDPEESERTDILSGIDGTRLYLHSRPVKSILSLKINGQDQPVLGLEKHDNYVYRKEVFPQGIDNIVITYTAGWTNSEMPSSIVMAILRIASLMAQESDGNIGVSGINFSDNSRSFINYSNYDKYLEPLKALRVVRFE